MGGCGCSEALRCAYLSMSWPILEVAKRSANISACPVGVSAPSNTSDVKCSGGLLNSGHLYFSPRESKCGMALVVGPWYTTLSMVCCERTGGMQGAYKRGEPGSQPHNRSHSVKRPPPAYRPRDSRQSVSNMKKMAEDGWCTVATMVWPCSVRLRSSFVSASADSLSRPLSAVGHKRGRSHA